MRCAQYVFEPLVYIALDIFALLFTNEHYGGIITEATVPYAGFRCEDTAKSQSWCGSFDFYEQRLSNSEESGSTFVDNSIVLGAQTSRRLSELTGEVIIPVLDMSALIDGVSLLTSSLITIGGSVSDMLMHVLYTILSDVAVLIIDVLFILVKELAKIVLMIVRSGMLEIIVTLAIDILIIYAIQVALPMIMALIDALMCVLDLMKPSGWDAQLMCINKRCFETESDALSDLIVFTSAPIVLDVVYSAIEATVNSKTSRSLFGDGFAIPTNDWSPDTIPALTAGGCAECFSCKIPELRLINLLIMSLVGCLDPSNLKEYMGGVESQCQDDGDWYKLACGEHNAFVSSMPDEMWRETYTAHRNHTEYHMQDWAAYFAQRGRETGGSGTTTGYSFELLANAWFNRDVSIDPDDQAYKMYRVACETMREQRGAQSDIGPSYLDYSEGSLPYEVGRFLYDTYARAR